jgi:16S rRNA (cytidine1402-2'-O)-methyltransferase
LSERGELVVVATPIGNMGDLSSRAVEALSSADVICCEDTRRTGRLLSLAGIKPPRLVSLHAHNEAGRAAEVIRFLQQGNRVALVSDAGTPAISDPGSRLVSEVHDAGERVTTVPGPSAAVTAVSIAGFGGARFRFEGFLPKRGRDREVRLAEVASSPVPVVIYEAPGRVDDLVSALSERTDACRRLTVCRELTKLHEEVWRGSLAEAAGRWPPEGTKGELVLVLDGLQEGQSAPPSDSELADAVEELERTGSSRRDAVGAVAESAGLSRRRVYEATGSRPKRGRGGTHL